MEGFLTGIAVARPVTFAFAHSEMEATMRLKPAVLIVGACVAATMVSGCVGRYKSDFPVVVENRTANAIQALANGSTVGQVAPGQTGTFSVQLPQSNANVFVNGAAPTPQADVTFTAKDTKTGALSSEKSVTLSSNTPTYVSFSADDFPSTGPTIARFTFSPTNPTINQDVSFNGTSSTVSNGTFAWDFGDGQSGAGATVTHQYSRAGTFTVTLSVTSDTKATSTSSRTITASGALSAATANFTFSPTNPSINQDVVFNNTGGGGGGGFGPGGPGGAVPGGTFAWDFGDGGTGTGVPVTHRYARGGTFTVTLRVTTDTGLSATSSRPITVSASLPAGSANFTFSPTDPVVGDGVFFNASSSTSGGTFTWDFGDGSSGSSVTPVHAYSLARTYTVTLTVVNALGQSATTSKTVPVIAGP
jgi:PKD repeat protein